MNHKAFKNIVDESEYDSYQALMYELDSSLERMRYISSSELTDAFDIECFDRFWDKVRDNEVIVVSVAEGSDLYELSDDSVLLILVEKIDEKLLVFDVQDAKKIIRQINNIR
jgi:hypothetical protein